MQPTLNVLQRSGNEIKAPVASTKVIQGSRPNMSKVFKVSHRELVGTFNNSTGFVVNGGVAGNIYRINPTNGTLFSWLPAIASNFDRYRFTSLSFEYVPMCGTNETGRVALYHDPDSQDNEPTDRMELANQWHLMETAPWSSTTLVIPVDQVLRFTQDSNVTDTKLVDFGQFGFVVYSGAGASVVGDVFVHYTIELSEPQPTATLVQTLQSGAGSSNVGPNFSAVTTANATTTVLTFRTQGVYLVNLFQRGTGLLSVVGNGVTINSQVFLQSGATAYCGQANVTVTALGGTITVTGAALGNYTYEVTRCKLVNNCALI
jgi:hypothetical protein